MAAMEKNSERRLMADKVSMALCQEADVRRNHEFFNGRNAASTPLSTVGHNLPVSDPSLPPFRRLLHFETGQTA
jgi:hypothetical protein